MEYKTKICDICGTERSSKNSTHWSDAINKISLSFKEHIGVQIVAFEGDCCTSCALSLKTSIQDKVKELKTNSTQGG